MYVGGSCVDEVACCDHTRVKCVTITWARCTRVASVRTPEGSLHRSDQSRRLCVYSVGATVQEARKCVRVRAERVSSAWPT
jgi:hypothetical protein